MKFLVVALLLALVLATTSAGVHKIIEEIEDRVNNGDKEDTLALAGVNETNNGYIADASASFGVNEIWEENETHTANGYNAAVPISAGFNETTTVEESEGRITNGYTAYAGQLPYQAFISIQNSRGSSKCGAVLISSQWLLTAAHCTSAAQSVTVYLGSIQRFNGSAYTVSRNNIIVHQSYNPYHNMNDISLIKIPAVSLNSAYIQPVRLPSISNYYTSYAGENVIVSGWGQTSDSNSAGSNYLQWARLQVITNNVCNAHFGYIASSHICISTPGGVSTCFGDSGGPMVLENSRVLIGLTSFGKNTCQSGYPTVFTRVTSYLDWIRSYTGIYYT